MANRFTDFIKKIKTPAGLKGSFGEHLFSREEKPMEFRVGEGLTPEQTKKAEEVMAKKTIFVKPQEGILEKITSLPSKVFPTIPDKQEIYEMTYTRVIELGKDERTAQKIAGEVATNPIRPLQEGTEISKLNAPEQLTIMQPLMERMASVAVVGFLSKAPKISGLEKLSEKGRTLIPKKLLPPKVDIKTPLQGTQIIDDPVQQMIGAIKNAKILTPEQQKLFTAERARRFGVSQRAGEIGGESGYFAELSKLKGELPKVKLEPIRQIFTQKNIDNLFNKINDHPDLLFTEKLTAKNGLMKLLNPQGVVLPAKGELTLMEEVYGKEFTDTLLKNRDLFSKFKDITGQVLGLPRALMSSTDLSYGLRQGVFTAARFPKEFSSAFGSQFKYFTSEDALTGLMKDIKNDPLYPIMRKYKLPISDISTRLGQQEEKFITSQLAEKIPVVGRLVRASNRAFTGFANKLRTDLFKNFYKYGQELGIADNPEFLNSVVNFISSATGRGKLGSLERSAGTLSTVLFSPRLLASRINLLNPKYYYNLHPAVRKRALQSLITFLAAGTTIAGLAKAGGALVELNPLSSDFGKIKKGNTRLDIWGGFQQPIVAFSRILMGKSISSTTGKIYTLGEGYKPITRFDIALRFFESKESPIVSFITSLLKGQTPIGEKFSAPKELINRITPMMIQDLADLYNDNEFKDLPFIIPGMFGVGIQTYKSKKPSNRFND